MTFTQPIFFQMQFKITGTVDWEFTYAAPAGVVYRPHFGFSLNYLNIGHLGLMTGQATIMKLTYWHASLLG